MRIRFVMPRSGWWTTWTRVGVGAFWLLAGGALLLFVFGVSFYSAMRIEMRASEVVVPDLQGMDLDAAARAVEPLDLVLEVVEQRHDPTVPSGKVLQQEPSARSSVRRGRKIKLLLSLGGKVLEVPRLVGEADRAVSIRLRQVGLIPGDEARVSSFDVAPGTVMAQVPPAASPTVPNTRVHRLVSAGPPQATWVMPDLTGLREEEAVRWIELAGFRRGAVRRVTMSGWSAQTVVGQLPLAGYPVRTNDVVEITVAR